MVLVNIREVGLETLEFEVADCLRGSLPATGGTLVKVFEPCEELERGDGAIRILSLSLFSLKTPI